MTRANIHKPFALVDNTGFSVPDMCANILQKTYKNIFSGLFVIIKRVLFKRLQIVELINWVTILPVSWNTIQENEWTVTAGNNMQESHKNNTESKGPDTKEYMPYDFLQKVENGQK